MMLALANIHQPQDACTHRERVARLGRRGYRKPHRVSGSLSWSPWATGGVAKIAERFENVGLRNFALVPWCGAMPAPSGTER